MIAAIKQFDVLEPERKAARKGANFLDRAALTERAGLFMSKPGGRHVVLDLPSNVLSALRALLENLAEDVVLLAKMETELSPEEAAKILGVSRPMVYHRMDSGRLPFRPVGSHRRVLLKDVLALRDFEVERRRVAQELSEDTDALKQKAAKTTAGLSGRRPNRGPFATEDEALKAVVERLVNGIRPEQIWLFGSRAEGRNAPDSDFDLLVVTSTESGEAGFDYDAAYAPIRGLGVGCDIVPCRVDEFEQDRDDRTSLCWSVVHSGKKLYDRAEENRRVLHAR
jgi:excisionase family DNA binding protein